MAEPQDVGGQERGCQEVEHRGRKHYKGVGEGQVEGGEEDEGEKGCLETGGPHQAVHNVHQRLAQLPEKREALDDDREKDSNAGDNQASTVPGEEGESEADKSPHKKAETEGDEEGG